MVEYYASFIFTGTFTGTASSGFCNLLRYGNLEMEARVGIGRTASAFVTPDLFQRIQAHPG